LALVPLYRCRLVSGKLLSMALDGTTKKWGKVAWAGWLVALTAATLCVQGYHPFAEDGGVYVAGVEYSLNHLLFPHYTAFVTAPLRYSLFAPVVAEMVRGTGLSTAWVIFLLDLLSIWLTLWSARQILRRVFAASEWAQLAGVALLGAWWTLPIAGTSLMLMDPYVTARSFSTPLTLLAIAYALDDWSGRSMWLCFLWVAVAGVLHPLMAGYGVGFVVVVRVLRAKTGARWVWAWVGLALIAVVGAGVMQGMAPVESAALRAAGITRYYWFLSQWQWYEVMGVVGPMAIFAALLLFARGRLTDAAALLCRVCLTLGTIGVLVALLFARESLGTYLVARMQVLRVYLPVYALMAMLLGALLQQACAKTRALRMLVVAVIAAMAVVMFFVQRQTFPRSQHLELPWLAARNPNPWVQAFLWAKKNTPRDALFALDAKYVNTDGEDAQTFRATALRSAVPDYSKDGGEAAIDPALAAQWQEGAAAQKGLSPMDDAEREVRLNGLGVTWMVLHADAVTADACSYDNGTVKVCRFGASIPSGAKAP
jgi:hypothetical protein